MMDISNPRIGENGCQSRIWFMFGAPSSSKKGPRRGSTGSLWVPSGPLWFGRTPNLWSSAEPLRFAFGHWRPKAASSQAEWKGRWRR